MERLKPLNDFIFKKLFGEKGDEPMLLSFLNAVLQKTHREEITSITISLVDFEFLEISSYHSSYHLWEDEKKDYMLTDLVEIHFIELPKFRKLESKDFKANSLQRWLAFLEKDVSKTILEELMQLEPAIKMAEDKLDYLSSDPLTRELYKAREYTEHERANLYSSGRDDEKIEIAKNMLNMKLSLEIITKATGLSIEEINKLL